MTCCWDVGIVPVVVVAIGSSPSDGSTLTFADNADSEVAVVNCCEIELNVVNGDADDVVENEKGEFVDDVMVNCDVDEDGLDVDDDDDDDDGTLAGGVN